MFLPKYTSGKFTTPDGAMIEYVEVGSGTPVLLIPGGGDGLRTVGGSAMVLAHMFRDYAARHRLVLMSRREPVPAHFSAPEFARDYLWAMEQLNMGPSHVECNSAGGPVGQQMAVLRPDRVRSLVLGETFAHADKIMATVIQRWVDQVKEGRYADFQIDSVTSTGSPAYVRKSRWLFPLFRLKAVSNIKNPQRLIRILEDVNRVDNRPILPQIACPTLVIGGDVDIVTHPGLQAELAEKIPGARRISMPGLGHLAGSGEGAKEHHHHVLKFFADVEAGAR